jgi:hypothetical protein
MVNLSLSCNWRFVRLRNSQFQHVDRSLYCVVPAHSPVLWSVLTSIFRLYNFSFRDIPLSLLITNVSTDTAVAILRRTCWRRAFWKPYIGQSWVASGVLWGLICGEWKSGLLPNGLPKSAQPLHIPHWRWQKQRLSKRRTIIIIRHCLSPNAEVRHWTAHAIT